MVSKIKATIISEFSKLELPYPMSEWSKCLSNIKKSGGKVTFYSGRRKTNFLSYYLLEQALLKKGGNDV